MVRIDVVLGAEDAPIVRDLFTRVGVSGFTSVSHVSGMGHGGWHEGRLAFNDLDSLLMLFTVVPHEAVETLIEGLRVLFAERPGVFFVSETAVSRPSYFELRAPQ